MYFSISIFIFIDEYNNQIFKNKNLNIGVIYRNYKDRDREKQLMRIAKAVKLFNYIHSLDDDRLALKLSHHEKELNKKVKLFIQVNLADEPQKSGIMFNDLNNFYNYCTKDLSLNVIGLMCMPPVDSNSQEYFKKLKKAAQQLNLEDLSMGMSSDYEQAILSGSTYLRLGTTILGERNSN